MNRSDYARERDRTDAGQFQPEYDEDAFLKAVREHDPATTAEVAEAVGCVRQNAIYRLKQLREAGAVTSKKAGQSTVWMPADPDRADA
jgi:predicted transcriptional regulator